MFRELDRTPYAFSLVLSISRREEPFPLAQHFHPDHHDPDDRVPLTVRSVFSLFLSASPHPSLFIHLAKNFSANVKRLHHACEQCRENRTRARFATRFQLSRERRTERIASGGRPARREERSERQTEKRAS